jgi:hypothetical protein
MWIEPASVAVTPSMVGKLFNVTCSLNMTEAIYAWQTELFFDGDVTLNCTRAGYTDVTTSNYFKGHTTTSPGPSIDNVKGTLLIFETCLGSDFVAGPHNGTLFWAEFKILSVPNNMRSVLNITKASGTGTMANTWVVYEDGSTLLPFKAYDGVVVPEFSGFLILPALMVAATVAMIISKRVSRKKPR